MNIQQHDEIIAWLALVRDKRFTCSQKHKLLNELISPVVLYQTGYSNLCQLLNIRADHQKNEKFQLFYNDGNNSDINKDLMWLQKEGNYLICWGDKFYPQQLSQISDPPICLFASGNLHLLLEPKISIVGSRRPTPAGANMCKSIAKDLAHLGLIVTSGMALGVDAISHKSALQVNEPTIAVMGCGLDIISPARHRALFNSIVQKGLVLSEYPIAYPASKYTFPKRNRIVSGLSYGVVIIEAADKSGTLITARLAMEQNREVFVVPGSPLNPQYIGSHRLIKQGAILINGVEDILSELSGTFNELLKEADDQSTKTGDVVDEHKKMHKKFPLLAHIDYAPTPINAIISDSGLTVSEVSSMLLILEVNDLIAIAGDGSYMRIR